MNTKVISGSNYFQSAIFNNIVELLNKGEVIELYISCIGHTRAQIEANKYRKELLKYFGDDLEITIGLIGNVYKLK